MSIRRTICTTLASRLTEAINSSRFYPDRKIKNPPTEYGAVIIPDWHVDETDLDGTHTYSAELVIELFTEATYQTDTRLDEFSDQVQAVLASSPLGGLHGLINHLQYTGGHLGDVEDTSPPSLVLNYRIQYEEENDNG